MSKKQEQRGPEVGVALVSIAFFLLINIQAFGGIDVSLFMLRSLLVIGLVIFIFFKEVCSMYDKVNFTIVHREVRYRVSKQCLKKATRLRIQTIHILRYWIGSLP
jgi:ABC-type transport system involved in cytochrome bd biosynthesis fused ATPase/permease subunit